MTEADATGVRLMREHEAACERETSQQEPALSAVLRDVADCIVESAHAFEGLSELTEADQAILIQIVLGARTARVFVGLALSGHYESAMAVARTLIEDGIACAYLMERPDQAVRWRRREIDPKYGDMAKAVIEAHAAREDAEVAGEGESWRRFGEVLRKLRQILDDMSHANPARISFVLTSRGYELYPFFDRDALRATAWFGLLGLAQMLFFTRKRLGHHGKPVPPCSTDALRQRISSVIDDLEATESTSAAPDESAP